MNGHQSFSQSNQSKKIRFRENNNGFFFNAFLTLVTQKKKFFQNNFEVSGYKLGDKSATECKESGMLLFKKF